MSCVVPVKFERLPELAKPTHYAVTLSPDFKNFTFRGQETTEIEVNYIAINKILVIITQKCIALLQFQFTHINIHFLDIC